MTSPQLPGVGLRNAVWMKQWNRTNTNRETRYPPSPILPSIQPLTHPPRACLSVHLSLLPPIHLPFLPPSALYPSICPSICSSSVYISPSVCYPPVYPSIIHLSTTYLLSPSTYPAIANLASLLHFNWRRKWHPTPVLLPGKSHGQRSLVGYSPWSLKESDTTERLHFIPLSSI